MKETIVVATLCSLLSMPVLAELQQVMPERTISTGEFPVVDGVGSLTVSGGDYWHKDIYEDGERPSLSVYDSSGLILADGNYRYEFRSRPSISESDSTASNNTAFDLSRGKRQRGEIVRGQFEIRGGEMSFR